MRNATPNVEVPQKYALAFAPLKSGRGCLAAGPSAARNAIAARRMPADTFSIAYGKIKIYNANFELDGFYRKFSRTVMPGSGLHTLPAITSSNTRHPNQSIRVTEFNLVQNYKL